jgi:hypothetical protein
MIWIIGGALIVLGIAALVLAACYGFGDPDNPRHRRQP